MERRTWNSRRAPTQKQGRITCDLLTTLEVPWEIIGESTADPLEIVSQSITKMNQTGSPVAVVVRKGTFSRDTHKEILSRNEFQLTREEVIKTVVNHSPKDTLFVSTTGMTSRELYEIRKNSGCEHKYDFLTVGSMGHSSSNAYGLAISQPKRTVICLDGDGAMLMHLGSLAIEGTSRLPNLKHIVINNGAHDSVGGQPTVGHQIDLQAIARGCGYANAYSASSLKELHDAIQSMHIKESTSYFLEVKVKKGYRSDLGRPSTSPLQNKMAFMSPLVEDV